jgi:hypothetical protein
VQIIQDIRACIEQLQTIEKEVSSLETSQKELADLRDHLDGKNIERSELQMKQDVRPSFVNSWVPTNSVALLSTSASTNNYLTRRRNSNEHKNTPRTNG